MYIVITGITPQNRIWKSIGGLITEQDAIDELAKVAPIFPDAFYAEEPQGTLPDWLVDPVAETLSYVPDIDLYKAPVIEAINALRGIKKSLPILTEGYLVDADTLSSGAMAVEHFAYSKSAKEIVTLTSSGNVATAVFDKNHHLKDGVTGNFSGADQAQYNVSAVITWIDKKTIEYPIAGPATSPATGTPLIGIGTYRWITNDNQVVFWTQDEFDEIFQACTEYLGECQLRGRVLKDLVLTSSTVAEIEAIDIETGWPDTGV